MLIYAVAMTSVLVPCRWPTYILFSNSVLTLHLCPTHPIADIKKRSRDHTYTSKRTNVPRLHTSFPLQHHPFQLAQALPWKVTTESYQRLPACKTPTIHSPPLHPHLPNIMTLCKVSPWIPYLLKKFSTISSHFSVQAPLRNRTAHLSMVKNPVGVGTTSSPSKCQSF